MDFLNKIKQKFFKKRKNTFHEQVQQEKKQKYLFRSDEEDVYVAKRGMRKTLLGKEKRKNLNPAYSTFFQKSMEKIGGDRDLKHFMAIIGAILIMLVVYIVTFSPYFKISATKVLIEPMTDGVDLSIVQRSAEVAYGKSIFILNEDTIAKNIKENLKNTEMIRIERLLPNGIKILVKSLPIQLDATIFGVENKRFGVSSNGVLVPIADMTTTEFSRHLQLVSSELQTELFFGYKKVISDRSMFVITKIFELFEKEWPDFTVASANYFVVENELHIVLESNTKIIFDLQGEVGATGNDFSKNLLEQLVTLQTYINSNNTNRAGLLNGSTMYLDVRVPGKIFSCPDSVNCKQNLISVYGRVYE